MLLRVTVCVCDVHVRAVNPSLALAASAASAHSLCSILFAVDAAAAASEDAYTREVKLISLSLSLRLHSRSTTLARNARPSLVAKRERESAEAAVASVGGARSLSLPVLSSPPDSSLPCSTLLYSLAIIFQSSLS